MLNLNRTVFPDIWDINSYKQKYQWESYISPFSSTIKISNAFLVKSVESSSFPYSEPYSESSSRSFIKYTHSSFGTTCGLGVDKSIDGTGSGNIS